LKQKLVYIVVLFFCAKTTFAQKLTAQQAVDSTLQKNLQLQIVRNNANIAAINNNWGNAGKYPTVSGTVGNSESVTNIEQELSNGTSTKRDGALTNNLTAGVNAQWRIYNGLRVQATKQRLAELQKQGELLIQKQMQQLSFDALVLYFNIVRLNQQVKALRGSIELAAERKKIAETRFNVGSAAKTDFLQASVDLNEQQLGLLNLQQQILVSKTNLNNLMQRDLMTPFEVADTTVVLQNLELQNILPKLQSKNVDLLIEQKDMAIAMQTKKEINSQKLPTVALNGNLNFGQTISSAGLFLRNISYGPNIGVTVGIPIYQGGNVKNQLKVADLQIQNQQLTIDNLQQQLNTALVNAFNEYKTAKLIATAEEANLKLAEENNFIATERFRKLQSNSIELRQAQLSLLDAQTRLFNAENRAKMAELMMLLLSGDL
jgi:outer membrane protein